ncbi:right-handed parallel beta-helix repeat-containing protein, partial [bacterium]|nr:right-handed parallel beta-helix repeat-containing protein [bacterium]
MDGIFVEGFPGNGICTLEGTVHFEIKDSGANKNGGAGAVFNGKDIKVSHFTAIGNIGTGVIINAISSIFNKLKINYNGTGIEANGSDITITESESINNISADLSVSATATNVNVSTSTITKIEDNSNGQLALDSATKASLCPANYNPSEDGLMCILICSRTDQFDHNGICIDECPAGTLVDRYRICRKIGSADPVYDTAVDVGVDGDDAGSGGCGCTMAESKTPIADAAILLILALVPLTFAIRKRVAITMGNFSKIKRVSIITLTIFIFNLAANLGSVKWVQGVAHATDKTVYAGAKYAEAELKKNLPINIVKILKETEGLHDYSYEFITSGDVFTDHIYADESYDDGYGDGGGDFGDGEDDGDYDSGEGDFGDIDNGTTVDDDDGNPIEWQESQNDLDAEAEAVDLDDLDAEAEAVDLDDVDWASYPEPDMSLDEIIAEYESFDNSAITVEAEVEDYNEDDEFIAALNKGSDDSAINAEAEAYLPTDMDDWYEAAREEQRAKDERDEAYKSMTACQSSDDGCSDPEYGEYMQVAK